MSPQHAVSSKHRREKFPTHLTTEKGRKRDPRFDESLISEKASAKTSEGKEIFFRLLQKGTSARAGEEGRHSYRANAGGSLKLGEKKGFSFRKRIQDATKREKKKASASSDALPLRSSGL